MSTEEGKSRRAMSNPPYHQPPRYQYQYGTFGVPDYSQPAIGFPQPVAPPSVAVAPSAPAYPPPLPILPPYSAGPHYYAHGYQTVPGYAAVAEGRPLRMPRLQCCGMGLGWFLFIIGFFLAAVPWYVGAFILLCVRVDYREIPGFVACTIAAVLFALAVILGIKKETILW